MFDGDIGLTKMVIKHVSPSPLFWGETTLRKGWVKQTPIKTGVLWVLGRNMFGGFTRGFPNAKREEGFDLGPKNLVKRPF